MKVAFTFISMPVGGAEDFAVAVSRHLPDPWEPVFVCLRDLGAMGEELKADGAAVHLVRAAPGKQWNVPGIFRLASWLRKEDVRVVHSQTYNAHTYAIPAARLAGAAAILHQQKTLEGMRRHRMMMMRRMTRLAHRTIALSEKTRAEMASTFRLPDARTAVIPNVVDPEEFHPAGDRATLRRELGLDPEKFLIGSVGSLNEVKNHPATLRMLARLRKDGHSGNAILLGEGKERANLEALRCELGLDDCLDLPGNRRPVAPWLQALDLVVHPSHWEGQPLALLQAAACKLPIVASRIEGNSAALGDNYPGLFEADDEDAYHALVERCLKDEDFRRSLADSLAPGLLPLAPKVALDLTRIYDELVSR